jgi:hypothetical protein
MVYVGTIAWPWLCMKAKVEMETINRLEPVCSNVALITMFITFIVVKDKIFQKLKNVDFFNQLRSKYPVC